ncbi:hypothetical protein SEEN2RVB_15492, partial [Salmonella enterica subsp. enterica serovar Newport str. A182RVB]
NAFHNAGKFGAGEASTKAIFDGLFKRVMLDKILFSSELK